MSKRNITKSQINFLEEELNMWKKEDMITQDQKNNIIDLYGVKSVNFIKVVLLIGALLVGLGVLSFIASNWDKIGKISKFVVIISLYIVVNISSYKTNKEYPKLSSSLLYLGILVYGAGIFLVGQIFNFGGDFTTSFLLWGIGILPIAILFKDKLVFIFSHALFIIYLNGYFNLSDVPYWIIPIVPMLYYINILLKNSKLGTFFNNLVLLNTIGYFLHKQTTNEFFIVGTFLIIGILMYYVPVWINKEIFKIEGLLTIGIAGLFLTSPHVWKNFSIFRDGHSASIVFSICFIIYLLTFVKKGSLLAIAFICATILRYYFDTLYDFMPKSVFFMLGGLILLGFGYYFEKMRNKRGGDFIEK